MRRAFTLVEVVTVLAVISVLAGMTAMMMASAQQTARASRTNAVIATVNQVLMEKMESYLTRRLPVNHDTTQRVVVLPETAARIRLQMVRDLMRMDLPDRMIDVTAGPALIREPVYVVDAEENQPIPVIWRRSGANRIYQNRALSTWTAENESAECLYLILATTQYAGQSALSLIPSAMIGDTDGDGMPEILDGWGRPLGFIRWPAGFAVTPGADHYDPYAGEDEFDLLMVDWGHKHDSVAVPYGLRPLVVSAGPDGEFGLRFPSDVAGLNYANMPWTTPAVFNGYRFIDPYLRQPQYENRGLPGEVLSVRDATDNLTNYLIDGSL